MNSIYKQTPLSQRRDLSSVLGSHLQDFNEESAALQPQTSSKQERMKSQSHTIKTSNSQS